MQTELYQQQINNELKSMDQRLYDLEEKMISIDGKLTQVVDAILGNALTKTGGFINDIEDLKSKIKELETKIQKQEEFKKKITWTIGIILAIAAVIQYIANLLSKIN
jgi:peptidoglycan hydrolase CwlO-like protein